MSKNWILWTKICNIFVFCIIRFRIAINCCFCYRFFLYIILSVNNNWYIIILKMYNNFYCYYYRSCCCFVIAIIFIVWTNWLCLLVCLLNSINNIWKYEKKKLKWHLIWVDLNQTEYKVILLEMDGSDGAATAWHFVVFIIKTTTITMNKK